MKKWLTGLWVCVGCLVAAVIGLKIVNVEFQDLCLELIGDERVFAEAGSPYEDAGATAYAVGKIAKNRKAYPYEVEGVVDTSAPGCYELIYHFHIGNKEVTCIRFVEVGDTIGPVIELATVDGYSVSPLFEYEEEGFSAYDACDGDVTHLVSREVRDGKVIYTVSDSSGNVSVAERVIPYCDWKPEIVLVGGDEIIVESFSDYEELGFTAFDTLGNDLSSLVVVEMESHSMCEPGVFHVTYSCSFGEDTVCKTRTVNVVAPKVPKEKNQGSKVIYLTFDDGPSYLTSTLLDILAKYNVKATFFVTGQYPKYFDMIGRAFREGHTIGVHSYSHSLTPEKSVYKSEKAYWTDIDKMQAIIYKQTGTYSRLLRFVGGSATISYYNSAITKTLVDGASDRGYLYVDWNVSSGDGANHTTEFVVKRVKSQVVNYNVSIVLMHDNRDFTVAGVEEIILWGLKNGYTFKALTLESYASQQVLNSKGKGRNK